MTLQAMRIAVLVPCFNEETAVATVVGIGAMFQIVALAAFVAWLLVALSTRSAREAAGLAKRHTIGPTAHTARDAVGGQRSE